MTSEEKTKAEWAVVEAAEPGSKEPRGFIQWKGTEVCMDIVCGCGASLHFDGEFFYNFKCGSCGKCYACSPWVKMLPLDFEPDEVKVVNET